MATSVLKAAEDIFTSMLKGESKPIRPSTPYLPKDDGPQVDIREVTVPDDYTNLILEKSFEVEVEKKPVKQKVSINETAQSLVSEFSSLLVRAKQLIEAMTTCGMIGVNTAKPKQKIPVKKLIRK